MAITKLPPELHIEQPLICAICGVNLSLDKATAGMYDADHNQTFACVSHFSEVEKLIVGWAIFTATQRRKHVAKGQDIDYLMYQGSGDV